MHKDDFNYANDIKSAIDLRTPATYVTLIRLFLGMFVVFMIWAITTELDEIVRAEGSIIPSSQVQVVQSLEGGIVQDILFREGDVVSKKDILMRIDDTNFSAQLGEISERRAALVARTVRLRFEAHGDMQKEEPLFPEELRKNFPEKLKSELSLYKARLRKFNQDVQVLEHQVSQKRRELQELEAQVARYTESLVFLKKELEITRKLYKRRVVPEVELLRLERQASEAEGQLNITRASIKKSLGSIEEALARRDNVLKTFRASAEEELSKSESDLSVIEETIRAAQDRVSRAELRSPVNGIVNKTHVTTIGEVIQPGQKLVEIVPIEDKLLVEGKLRPADIAFIHPNQKALVKISAYDSTVYGLLHGKVVRISADTLKEERARGVENFYRVIIQTEKNHLGDINDPLPIIPGMVANVEILTGKKTVFDYLLGPVRKVLTEALKER